MLGGSPVLVVNATPGVETCCPMQHWVTGRQMHFEGGFQGRCNKLVDGCYSFWQAGLLPLLHRALHAQGEWGEIGLVCLQGASVCGRGRGMNELEQGNKAWHSPAGCSGSFG